MTAVAQYFARVGIAVDNDSLSRVDKYFMSLQKKVGKYRDKLGKGVAIKVRADLDVGATLATLRKRLDAVGKSLTLRISRVQLNVTTKGLKGQAEKQLSTGLKAKILPYVTRNDLLTLRKSIQFGLTSIPVELRYSRLPKLPTLQQRIMGSVSGGSGRASGGSSGGGRSGGGIQPFKALGGLSRGLSGFVLRGGLGAVPFIGGAAGVLNLNEANTLYQSQKIAANNIFAKEPGGGKAALDRLYGMAQYAGLDYAAMVPEFNRFMSGAMPSMGYEKSFKTFQAVSQYGRAMGSDPDSINRALKAFSQMAGKGKVGAEELRQQLADAAGFGGSQLIFAEAYAKSSKSGLTGQKAIAALNEAMKKGKVNFPDIAELVAERMQEVANPAIEEARKSASAAQMRARNARRKALESFSEAGGERGLAKMWLFVEKIFANLGDRSNELGEAFEKLMTNLEKYGSHLLNLTQTLATGASNDTTRAIEETTGVDVAAVRLMIGDALSKIWGVMKDMGFWGSVAALAAATVGVKMAGGALRKQGQEANGKLGNPFSNLDRLSAYAQGNALRVWVVNQTPGAGGDIDIDGKGKGTNTKPRGRLGRMADRLKDWAGELKDKIGSNIKHGGKLLKGVGIASLLTMLAPMFTDNKYVNAAADVVGYAGSGATVGMALGGPLGAVFGGIGGGLYGVKEASHRFTDNNVAKAAPIVEKSVTNTLFSRQSVDLKANIKIEAGTPEQAIKMFEERLNAQVFQPMMYNSLLEAQNTMNKTIR